MGCLVPRNVNHALQFTQQRGILLEHEQLTNRVAQDEQFPLNTSVSEDPSYFKTKATFHIPCLSGMNTCKGGISHLEVEPFWIDRHDTHPGSRCYYAGPYLTKMTPMVQREL